jgi:uncharacterized LabA/DUF88 family protein
MGPTVQQRAIVFIDGNNWYHSLRRHGVAAPFELDYAKISQKLLGPRNWVETRYYIGALPQDWNPRAYADQRRFLDQLARADTRVVIRLGRLEPRPEPNPLAASVLQLLSARPHDFTPDARSSLEAMVRRHSDVVTLKEKAVDIMLAVDLIRLAYEDRYDAAYILSADGDFSPAAEAAQDFGRTVYAASMDVGYALRKAVKTYIHLRDDWLKDCYRVTGSR